MQFIDRNLVPRPPFFDSTEFFRLKSDQDEFYRRDMKSRRQKRSPFESQRAKFFQSIAPVLRQLFSDKCAYCERSEIGKEKLKVVPSLFRPHSDAMNLNGTTDSDHYWWLTYEWSNQYLVCSSCDSLKINRFPVVGERSGPASAALDQPLLIDPCRDHPEQYLRFTENGRVTGVHLDGAEDRGEYSIELIGLNRDELVKSRMQTIRQVRNAWEKFEKSSYSEGMIAKLLRPQQRHLGLVRQLLARRVLDATNAGQNSEMARKIGELRVQLQDEIVALGSTTTSKSEATQDTYSPPIQSTHEAMRQTRVVYIARAEIRNFKGIDKLNVAFQEGLVADSRSPDEPSGDSSVSRWKMLLGENGTGKSTVLQAVALALAWSSLSERSEDERTALGLTSEKLLRDGSGRGSVKVYLSDSSVVTLILTLKRILLQQRPDLVPFVRGYGATRLTAATTEMAQTISAQRVCVDNLFNPLARLVDSEKWLLQLDDTQFGIVAKAIKDLIQSPQEIDLIRESGHVRIGTHRFDRLSDGYRSLVAVACDLMAGVPHPLSDLRNAAGVAIIDELDSHLHPRWKMQVVARLRKTFPSMQFITSTHDPLCLRGLSSGQVAVFRRDVDSIQMQDSDLPSPAGLRVDQLLTSPHFGMNSTIEPELDDLFGEYYQLLAIQHRTADENKKYTELKQKVDQHRVVLGYTRRDQMVYELIDECLSREATAENAQKRRSLREDTKKKVLSLWNYGLNTDGAST